MPTKPQTLETETSRRLFARAVALIPGGVNSPVRAWRSVGGEPLFLQRGVGARIWDADENEFLDYVGSWGPLILGHAHPTVIATIQNTAVNGTSFGTPTELEIKLAERIVGAVPSIERVRFVNSGTEATMSALRLARAFTGRTKLIKFDGGYHGHADFLLAKAGSGIATLGLPDSAGVPTLAAADTLVAPYNDAAAVEKLFEQNRGEIAAVIVEPIAGNMGVVAPQAGYLTQLREITTAHGALLIFDEVISGFRAAWGGAQSLYGVTPDLTCLGKIIGGGLPVGAYGGRRDIMELVAPLGPMYQAGTLSGNPLAMAAGLATLDTLRQTPSAYAQLEALGAELEEGLRAVAHEANVPLTINRAGSLLTAFFTNVPVTDYASAKTSDTKRFAQWFQGMLQDHIYLAPSQFEAAFISLAHTPHDIARTVESAARVLTEIGRTGARQV